MSILRFLCGCNLESEHPRLKRDSEGFLVCPLHQEREYGWRTREALALGRLPSPPSMTTGEAG